MTKRILLQCWWLFVLTILGQCAADEPAKESWITFVSHRSGGNLLYKMRPDGSNCETIFGGPLPKAAGLKAGTTLYREPHWTWQSPDRRYFASWATDTIRPRENDGVGPHYSLFLGSLDGSEAARVVAPVCDEAAAWSPDGRQVAFAVHTNRDDSAHRYPATMSRIYVCAIDGSNMDFIFEEPGIWSPQDWSPDGKKLLLNRSLFLNVELFQSDLFEIDMTGIMAAKNRAKAYDRWQNNTRSLWKPVLGHAAPVMPSDARYSPDGKLIAVTAIRKTEQPGEWKSLDFELGIIERSTSRYRKVAWYEEGLRGPICWSPDGSQILFSRPLPKNDNREAMKPDDGALRQENGLGLWSIRSDGMDARLLTTGWSPDWR